MAGRARQVTGVAEDYNWGPPTWKPRHAHCPKCGACLKSPEQERIHKCPGKQRQVSKDLFWMRPKDSETKRQRAPDFPASIEGFPLAKVQRLAEKRDIQSLTDCQQRAVRKYLEMKLRNMRLTERAGEPERPILAESSFESRVWSINPRTGERTLATTVTIRKTTRVETVTSHAQAMAALTGETPDGDDISADENTTEFEVPQAAPSAYFLGCR